jgi:hypothetical protein
VTFSSVVSIQICIVKNANPSFYIIHVENDYFPLPFEFKMYKHMFFHPTALVNGIGESNIV